MNRLFPQLRYDIITRIVVSFAFLALITSFVLVANAHPGSTDSSGGHYNRGTGEYHYHHGYPAHNHYDMDGDGVHDCPYSFDDKTGQNSGNSSTSNSSSVGSFISSESTHSQRSIWNSLTEFFSTAYGTFCIVAVILQIIIAIILMQKNLNMDYFGILLAVNIILFTVSLPFSLGLLLVCALLFMIGAFLFFSLFPLIFSILSAFFRPLWKFLKSFF